MQEIVDKSGAAAIPVGDFRSLDVADGIVVVDHVLKSWLLPNPSIP